MRCFTRLLLLGIVCTASPAHSAREWTVRDGSRLGFTASWEGVEFDGVFHRFDPVVIFDPGDLPGSRFDVKIDVTSADTRSSDRDEAMAGPEWFDYRRYPQSRFVTTGFDALEGGGRFQVSGTLSIKDVSKPISFPVQWEVDGANAMLRGETTLKRTDFHVGTGEWEFDGTVGFDVRVHFELRLEEANGAQ